MLQHTALSYHVSCYLLDTTLANKEFQANEEL
jgi:hypothetical protein